jgi:hypothetical protein
MINNQLNDTANKLTHPVQFQLRHALCIMLSFSIAAAVYTYDQGLGATLLFLISGFWFGYLLIGISNLMDARAFDERKLPSQIVNGIGIVLVGASGSLGIILTAMVLIGAIAWMVT